MKKPKYSINDIVWVIRYGHSDEKKYLRHQQVAIRYYVKGVKEGSKYEKDSCGGDWFYLCGKQKGGEGKFDFWLPEYALYENQKDLLDSIIFCEDII